MTVAARGPRSKSEAEEMHGEGEVQECPRCGDWHSIHSPPLCFACAVGLDRPDGGA